MYAAHVSLPMHLNMVCVPSDVASVSSGWCMSSVVPASNAHLFPSYTGCQRWPTTMSAAVSKTQTSNACTITAACLPSSGHQRTIDMRTTHRQHIRLLGCCTVRIAGTEHAGDKSKSHTQGDMQHAADRPRSPSAHMSVNGMVRTAQPL